jgi:membrane protease YdiL (CAAX protease family)
MYGPPEYAWSIGAWLVFAPLTLLLIASATRNSLESAPTARHPKAELIVLILYGALMQTVTVAARTGHFHFYAALSGALGNYFLSSIHSLPNPQTHVRLFDAVYGCLTLGMLPLLFLVSSGNGLGSMGFRRPHGRLYLWAPMAVAGLPITAFLVVGCIAASGLSPAVTALIFASVGAARTEFFSMTIRLARSLVGPAFSEELFFRAGAQSRIQVLLGNRLMAVLLSSWLFALFHLGRMPGQTLSYWLLALGDRMTVGIVLGYLFSRTGSILPGMLLHTFIDTRPS